MHDNGWAAEDWNFALDQAVEEEGRHYLYGYGQGRVSAERIRHAREGFDVLFYQRLPDGTFRAGGLYIGATYLDDDGAVDAWKRLKKAGHVSVRQAQLGGALGDDPEKAKRAQAELKRGGHVRWKVPLENVVVFDPQPVITPKRRTDHRHINAYDWSDHAWMDVPITEPDAELEMLEGRLITVVHRVRERSQAFRDAVVALRKSRLAEGRPLCCEACDTDLAERYGPALRDFVEAHHTSPLHLFGAEGGLVGQEQIALLCPNCHRAAHKTGAWTVSELKGFLGERTGEGNVVC